MRGPLEITPQDDQDTQPLLEEVIKRADLDTIPQKDRPVDVHSFRKNVRFCKYLLVAGLLASTVLSILVLKADSNSTRLPGQSRAQYGALFLIGTRELLASQPNKAASIVHDGLREIPSTIQRMLTTKIALDRVAAFLNESELPPSKPGSEQLSLQNATIGWSSALGVDDDSFKLRDVTLDLPINRFTLVCGALGAGKTLLRQHTLWAADVEGEIRRDPASSLPTARPGFFARGRHDGSWGKWSHSGERTAGNESDFQSGGQKARINLARCIYSRAKTVYLDDILSAVDAHTSQYIYRECLRGILLRSRTLVLVTHHVQLCLPAADYVVFLEKGRVSQAGPAKEAESIPLPMASMVVPLENRPPRFGSEVEVSHGTRHIHQEEHRAKGRVDRKTGRFILGAAGGYWFFAIYALTLSLRRILVVGSQIILREWSSTTDTETAKHSLMSYLVLHIGVMCSGPLRWIWLYGVGDRGFLNRANRQIHSQILDRLCLAPLQFFETIPQGRLMNVFGQDFWRLDDRAAEEFGMSVADVIFSTFMVVIQVPPGMRVGIVGTTGSGKSTLALSIFRAMEASGGRILIDGQERLNMVAQDGTLCSGTLRDALDLTQVKVYNALRKVHLLPSAIMEHDVVSNPFASLDTYVAPGGSNFSHGERQLLCLARALLKDSQVLVMDEATSSVDFEMDAKITATMKENFLGTTMIVIAHRLATIMGLVLEYASPRQLIQDPTSAFHALCMAAGNNEFERLLELSATI
ncbi:hypothetical protein P7C73_g2973, partial [Tremellales sp. Uapishka_1]